MTFIPATESAIVHPDVTRNDMPMEILIELEEFEASLVDEQPPAPSPAQLEDDTFNAWLDDLEELDADAIELLDDALALPAEPTPEPATPREVHPRTFEEHVAEIKAAGDDPVARRGLSLMGLGDIFGLEEVVAAITKTSETLIFWAPMLDMEQEGFFTAHHRELQACLTLLEAHPAPEYHPALRQRWDAARDELHDLLPTWAQQAVAVC